ncbi:MAG: hypothetical protein ACODAQ_12280 [Phycisphaeraceae bacterium]
MNKQPRGAEAPFRLASIATTWHHGGPESRSISHAAVILGRWLQDRPGDRAWGWEGPRTQLASLYFEQLRDDDAVYTLCPEHDIPLADSVAEALTLGGDELAVDGVLLIGEHGEYGHNELGQKLYPRKELFDAIVSVYERCGKVAPLFCDKHFSWNFEWAREMVETAQRMGFMLFGGSSIPHCPREPALPSLAEAGPAEMVVVYAGDFEAYGFHSFEFAQSYAETRPGGERGVQRVTVYEGDTLDAALRGDEWSAELLEAAAQATGAQLDDVQWKHAIVLDHADGLRVTHLHAGRGVHGWGLAVRREGEQRIHATRTVMGGHDDFHAHFAGLARIIEDAMLTGRQPFPVERTLLATGLTTAAMRGRAQAGVPLETSELAIRYAPLSV